MVQHADSHEQYEQYEAIAQASARLPLYFTRVRTSMGSQKTARVHHNINEQLLRVSQSHILQLTLEHAPKQPVRSSIQAAQLLRIPGSILDNTSCPDPVNEVASVENASMTNWRGSDWGLAIVT